MREGKKGPGYAEQMGTSNLFKIQISPLPAHGTRIVKIVVADCMKQTESHSMNLDFLMDIPQVLVSFKITVGACTKKPIKILQVEVLAQSNRFLVPTVLVGENCFPCICSPTSEGNLFLAFILIGIDSKWQKFSLVKEEEHITINSVTLRMMSDCQYQECDTSVMVSRTIIDDEILTFFTITVNSIGHGTETSGSVLLCTSTL